MKQSDELIMRGILEAVDPDEIIKMAEAAKAAKGPTAADVTAITSKNPFATRTEFQSRRASAALHQSRHTCAGDWSSQVGGHHVAGKADSAGPSRARRARRITEQNNRGWING